MSPRSQEFMEQAWERLAAARDLLATDHPASGRLDPELSSAAESAQRHRLGGDYEAVSIDPEVAEAVFADAERFVAAVDAELG